MSAGEEGVTERMCHICSEEVRGVYWSVRPRVGEGVGTGRGRVRVRWPWARQQWIQREGKWRYFGRVEGQGDGAAGAVADFCCEERRRGIILSCIERSL